MTDLIDEIQFDLEQEKQTKLIKKITKIFLSISIIAVLTISIYVIWNNYYISKHESESKEIELAKTELLNNHYDKALEKFNQVLNSKTSGFWELAALEIYKLNNKDITTLEKIVYESKNLLFVEIAALKLSNIFLEQKDFSKAQFYLSKINLDKGILKFTAKELNALLMLEQGKKEEAKKLILGLIQEKNVPLKIHTESEALLNVIENRE